MAYYSETVAVNQFYDKLIANMKANGWTEEIIPLDFTPALTSNSAPAPYAASSSPVVSATFEAWKAFNNTTADANDSWASPTLTGGNYLQLDLGASGSKAIYAYAITARNDNTNGPTAAPKEWRLEGSLDNVEWFKLDARSGTTAQSGWSANERRYFLTTDNSATAYRYIRLTVTANNGHATYVSLGELELMEAPDASKATNLYESLMRSSGSSGTENLLLAINRGSSKNTTGNHLTLAMMEASPSFGNYVNSFVHNYYFVTTSSQTNNTNVLLTYYMEVNSDRVFFATVLDPAANAAANNACYAGLMKRFSNESDNFATTIAIGITPATNGYAKVLKSKSNIYNANYATRVIQNNYSPSVWGDVVFVSPVFLEGDYEGMRGELEGVYSAHPNNLVNEDEIVVGTVRYKVILVSASANSAFPYNTASQNAPVLFKLPTA